MLLLLTFNKQLPDMVPNQNQEKPLHKFLYAIISEARSIFSETTFTNIFRKATIDWHLYSNLRKSKLLLE